MSEKNVTDSPEAAALAQAFPQLEGPGNEGNPAARAAASHLQAVPSPAAGGQGTTAPVPAPIATAQHALGYFGDVPVMLAFEVGRQDITVEQLMTLARGSIVPLQSVFVDSIDVKVSGRTVATAEAVSLKKRVGVRISEIAIPSNYEPR